jgi:PleD family two-component response regulator
MSKENNRPVVLVVDDSTFELKRVAAILGEAYDVRLAKTPSMAFRVLAQAACDVVLLDVEMPEMTGVQFFEKALAEGALKGARVVFLTSHTDSDMAAHVTSLGACGFLTKPIDPEELCSTLASTLANPLS